MSGPAHDAVVLVGMAVFDGAVLATWFFLCSRFMARSEDVITPPPERTSALTHAAPTKLHAVLGVVCLALLIGLIIECSGSAVWYVLRFGFTR